MAALRTPDPWKRAWELLRRDLRPAALYVKDGELRFGFRGPAAKALGELASEWLGGASEIPWSPAPLPSGELEACHWSDGAIVGVTLSGPVRRKQHPELARKKRSKETK